MQIQYRADNGTHQYIRKFFALPYLPSTQIAPQFRRLQLCATTPALQDLVEYVDRTWISGKTWPPSTWSGYEKPIRTNNDVEGWHNALNRRANGKTNLPFYLLTNLLFREASLVSLQIRLISERKLKRTQRRKYRQIQAKIFSHWEEYKTHQSTSRACSHLHARPRD